MGGLPTLANDQLYLKMPLYFNAFTLSIIQLLDTVILEGHMDHKENTGKYDRWVLDMANPDPEVLEVMKKYGMCIEVEG